MIYFRRANLPDIEALIELRLAMQEEIRPAPDEARERFRSILQSYLTESLPRDTFVAWIAEEDGKIVATSGLVVIQKPPRLWNPSGREAYILNMYTCPSHRGRGIASTLLQRLIEYAREMGLPRVSLNAQEAARPVYERAGFKAATGEMELRLEYPIEH